VSIVDDVRRLLSRAPGEPLCDACLALACASSLNDMRAAAEALAKTDPAFHRGPACQGCGRTVPTLFYRIGSADSPGRRDAAAS
jgi:hypothetical protein